MKIIKKTLYNLKSLKSLIPNELITGACSGLWQYGGGDRETKKSNWYECKMETITLELKNQVSFVDQGTKTHSA